MPSALRSVGPGEQPSGRQGLRPDGQSACAASNRGLHRSLVALGARESAMGSHPEACALAEPDEAVFVANRGIILGRLGRRDEAVEALQQALHLNSGLTGARSALRLVLEGNANQARLIEYQAATRRFDG